MKTRKVLYYCKWTSLLLLVVLAVFFTRMSTAWATNYDPWTTVASAGTVDEADIDYILFSNGYAYFDSLLYSHNVNIRYNVTSVDGLLTNYSGATLKVRYKDNGLHARVVVKLKSVNLSSGGESTLITFDSNNYPESFSYQLRTVTNCAVSFNFSNYAYYIDAYLIKDSYWGSPGLHIMQLKNCTMY